MRAASILDGVTRPGYSPIRNPRGGCVADIPQYEAIDEIDDGGIGDGMPHAPLRMQNRVVAEVWGPPDDQESIRIQPQSYEYRPWYAPWVKRRVMLDSPSVIIRKAHVDHRGNIMATYGLNRLIEMLASDSDGASNWVSAMAIGTSTTAAASTQDSLVASTQIVHLSQASMAASDAGARSLQYNATFASNGNACSINEVGLFATNAATANMVARSVLGTDSINRGASDEIRISYQVIAGTA